MRINNTGIKCFPFPNRNENKRFNTVKMKFKFEEKVEMLDPMEIRRDFPILKKTINGHKLIYFDNAATTQKPLSVIRVIAKFYMEEYANVHRGVHTLSQIASERYEEAREEVARFINAEREEIIFLRNASEALNMIAYTWGLRELKTEDEILTTLMEHHSNITPWINLSEILKFKIKYVGLTENGTLNLKELEEKMTDKTRIVTLTHMSNVIGTINPVKEIAKIAHENNALIIVDGAQSVPHMPIDVKKMDCDFLAFSGHKMLGPTGIGVLYVKKDVLEEMKPTISGGGTIKNVRWMESEETCRIDWAKIPERFEAGTPNIAGAVGLAEAIRYLRKIGMENVRKYEEELLKYTFKEMDQLDKIKIYGPRDPEIRGGIVSFNIGKLNPHQTALILDQYGIAVRSGVHCAEPLHQKIGAENGSVRASYYIYNTKDEIERMIQILKKIEEIA